MFKITYIVTGLDTGGAEIILYQLLCRLVDRKKIFPSVVSLVSPGKVGQRIASLGIPVHTLGMKPGMLNNPDKLFRLILIIRKLEPDLLQGWMYHGNIAAQLASAFSFRKIPVSWCIHYSLASLAGEKNLTSAIIRLGVYISKLPTNIIYVSQVSKLQHERLGYYKEKSMVIPNGFDTSQFKPSPEYKFSIRNQLGIAQNSFLIGLMGRFHPMKDHKNFLQAASLLLSERPNVNFILAGSKVDRDNQILNESIANFKIQQHTHLLGERDDMPSLIASLDILSVSSAYGEAFPLVVGEAMSCGVPCVVTDVGDSAWIVGSTGRVVPPRNPKALAQAWKELINLGSEGRKALGKAARARVIENFSLDSVTASYEALYEKIIAQKANTWKVI